MRAPNAAFAVNIARGRALVARPAPAVPGHRFDARTGLMRPPAAPVIPAGGMIPGPPRTAAGPPALAGLIRGRLNRRP